MARIFNHNGFAIRENNAEIDVINVTDDLRLFEIIKKVHPAFAKHMVENDKVMKMALGGVFGPGAMDLLDQPMCERCEKIGYWHGDNGWCRSCGHETKNPITLNQYLLNYTGKLAMEYDKRMGGLDDGQKDISGIQLTGIEVE